MFIGDDSLDINNEPLDYKYNQENHKLTLYKDGKKLPGTAKLTVDGDKLTLSQDGDKVVYNRKSK